MAHVYTLQYRPLSNAETCIDAGLSFRAVRDLSDNMNNYKRYVANFKLRSHAAIPSKYSADSTSDETCLLHFAPQQVATGYTNICWVLGHQRTAGSGNTIWRLYCLTELYTNAVVMNTALVASVYSVANIVTSNADHSVVASTELLLKTDASDRPWLVLTAQNTDGTTRSKVTTLDAWPTI